MPILTHFASEKAAGSIRRSGIKAHRWPFEKPHGVFCMPMLPNFMVTHQGLRELKRRGQRTIVAVDFRLPSGKKLERRQEGIAILVGLRLLGMLTWVALVIYLAAPGWISWATLPLPNWLRWAGAVLGILVVPPLWTWTFLTLGKNLTDTVVTRKEHTLVTRRPYRWVRHPFYDVIFLEAIALGLMAANGLLTALGLTVVVMMVIRSKVEEAKLIERFGKAYEDYADRTGRFVPLLGRRSRGAVR